LEQVQTAAMSETRSSLLTGLVTNFWGCVAAKPRSREAVRRRRRA
jgi:hypothetical protein